jgi:hypothetical protein
MVGFISAATVDQQAPEVYERVMKVNYLGVIYTVKAALPGMLERDQGRILIMSSLSGIVGETHIPLFLLQFTSWCCISLTMHFINNELKLNSDSYDVGWWMMLKKNH